MDHSILTIQKIDKKAIFNLLPILTDVDGVLLEWEPAFTSWMASKGYTVKQMQEGPAIVLKRKVTNKKGQKNPLPKLLDVNQQPIDILVGNGADVKVQYREWEATNSYGTFKGLDFQAMQVLNLVPYGGDASDDGAELGYIEEESEF